MSTSSHYVMCPFYRHDNKKSIACEDTLRRFFVPKAKHEWMWKFCDADYMSCPFAAKLYQAYEREERGEAMAVEKRTIESLTDELRRSNNLLGIAQKKVKSRDKDLKEEKMFKEYFEKLAKERKKELREKNAEISKLNAELTQTTNRLLSTTQVYEARFCYLMNLAGVSSFKEQDFLVWSKNKELRIIGDGDKNPVWKAEVNNVKV